VGRARGEDVVRGVIARVASREGVGTRGARVGGVDDAMEGDRSMVSMFSRGA